MITAAKVTVIAAASAWSIFHGGVLGFGAFLIALGAIFQFVVKPGRHLVKQATDIHGVLLGTDADEEAGTEPLPSLRKRLLAGDQAFEAARESIVEVTAKIDVVQEDLGKVKDALGGVKDRQDRGWGEFADVKTGLVAVKDGVEEVRTRIARVEGVFDVIGSTERLEIRSAIAAAAPHDPPPPPTPTRRDP